MTRLNVAEICANTRTLGPGKRFVIWVQGCCFNCPGCVSPDWIPQKQAALIEVKKLADTILSAHELDGLTVSGGEPMLQAEALGELFFQLREKRDISIICYSGFTLQELRDKNDFYINKILGQIDVLIDGQYIAELNDNRGWRGSSNQAVHFLTSRHQLDERLFLERKRDVEVHLRNDSALMVGVPPQQFKRDFHRALKL